MSGISSFLQEWIGALVSALVAMLLFVAKWLRSYTASVDTRQTAARDEAVAGLKQRIDDTDERINRLREDQHRHETHIAQNYPTRQELREMLSEIKEFIRQGDENILRQIRQLSDQVNNKRNRET